MATRFIEGSEEAYRIMNEVRNQYFEYLQNATIKILFDTKMRQKGNRLVLGRMLKANDLIRRLTDDLTEEGCDYIMFLDHVAFENITPVDRVRLIRHELRHCKVVGTPEKPKYKVCPHDIEDFVVEIELNQDNVGWARTVAELTEIIYHQMADAKKEGEETTRAVRRSNRRSRRTADQE